MSRYSASLGRKCLASLGMTKTTFTDSLFIPGEQRSFLSTNPRRGRSRPRLCLSFTCVVFQPPPAVSVFPLWRPALGCASSSRVAQPPSAVSSPMWHSRLRLCLAPGCVSSMWRSRPRLCRLPCGAAALGCVVFRVAQPPPAVRLQCGAAALGCVVFRVAQPPSAVPSSLCANVNETPSP